MNTEKYDTEESKLLQSYESDEWVSDLSNERRAQLSAFSEYAIKKDKRINIRISNRDLEALQRRALNEGMPYQTLIASVLHKFVSGRLMDVSPH